MNKILTLSWMICVTISGYLLGKFFNMSVSGLIICTMIGFFLALMLKFGFFNTINYKTKKGTFISFTVAEIMAITVALNCVVLSLIV